MADKKKLICSKCDQQLIMATVDFIYLEKTFHTDAYRCPSCGKVCILPELAEGKMSEVEHLLEDK